MSSYSANQWPWWYPNVILVLIISWQNFGSMITHDAKLDGGESVYIAKSAYKKMERVLTSRSVSMDTRLRLLTTGMLSELHCFTDVRAGQSANRWRIVCKQHKCGFSAECWRFHEQTWSQAKPCYAMPTPIGILCRTFWADSCVLWGMFWEKRSWKK